MTIRITSKRAGFRRSGIAHPAVATDYPDERFSAEELERLQAEPMLVVEVIDGKGKPAGSEATAAPGAAAAKPEPIKAKPVKAAPAKVAKAAKVTKAASGAKPAAKPAVEKTEPANQEPAGTQEQASGEGQ